MTAVSHVRSKWWIGLVAAGAVLLLGVGIALAAGLQGSSSAAEPSALAGPSDALESASPSATDSDADPTQSPVASPSDAPQQTLPEGVEGLGDVALESASGFGGVEVVDAPGGDFLAQVIVAPGAQSAAIITTDVDGSSATVHLESPHRLLVATSDTSGAAEWLPDGSGLIVAVVDGGATVVSSFSVSNETTATVATIPSAEPLTMSVSTDGEFVALTVTEPGTAEADEISTMLVNLATGGVQDLGNHSGATFVPGSHNVLVWTPQGDEAQLDVMTPTGSTSKVSETKAVVGTGFGTWPVFAFSPDGTRVAYYAGTGAWDGQVRAMNVDGTGDSLVAEVGWSASALEWSPTGDQLLFVSTGSAGSQLTIVAIGEGRTRPASADSTVRLDLVTHAAFLPDSSGVLVVGIAEPGRVSYLQKLSNSGEYYFLGTTGALTCAPKWVGTPAAGTFMWCGIEDGRNLLGSMTYEVP